MRLVTCAFCFVPMKSHEEIGLHGVGDWGSARFSHRCTDKPRAHRYTDTPRSHRCTDTLIAALVPIHRYTDCHARNDRPLHGLLIAVYLGFKFRVCLGFV